MFLDKKYKILVVDDAVDMQLLLEFDLVKAGCEVAIASSGQAAIDFFKTQSADLILLDLIMPGISGLETLAKLKSIPASKSCPVIMLSSSIDEDAIVKALDLGADDYVAKPYIARILLARIRTSLRVKENNLRLEKLAQTDFLTGINNKGNFISLANKAVSLAKRYNHQLVIAMLDIDYFKVINDEFGHHIGDLCLIAFTQCLIENFRDYDVLGRVGGEEFAVCLPETSFSDAFKACERFRLAIEKLNIPIKVDDKHVNITVSIGLSSTLKGCYETTSLLKQSDKALYYAKHHGRNQICNGDELEGSYTVGDISPAIIKIQKPSKLNEQDKVQPQTRDLPGIDYSTGISNVLGIDTLYQELLIMFYTEHNEDGVYLEKAIKDRNILATKCLAHQLKGVSKSIGAMELFSFAQDLDLAVNEERIDDFISLFTPLKDELDTVLLGIKEKLVDKAKNN